MIVKKAKANPKFVKSKATHIRELTDYIREPESHSTEKVLYANARNFLCQDHASQQAEMIALATESVRSNNPINHYVLSWREAEQPTVKQTEESVSIFLSELGLSEHQAIYGLHRDTDNIHLHIAVNRIHPETHKAVKINRGFDIEAAHRAIAKIEHEQGWQRERRGRYQVLENGDLGRELHDGKKREPEQRKRDMEHRTGEKSAERIAIEEAAPLLREAKSWGELHDQLAAKGMRYERKGSGALLWVGDVAVKASSVDRSASLSSMQKRLGQYQPGLTREGVQQTAEPIRKDSPGWTEYIQVRKTHYVEKERVTIEQRKQHDAEREKLRNVHKTQRSEMLDPIQDLDGRTVLRSVLAARQAAEKAEMKDHHRFEREKLREQHPRFQDYEEWLRERDPKLAQQWRYRMSEPDRIVGDRDEPPRPRDIRAFEAKICKDEVHYYRRAEESRSGGVSFVDRGRKIDIYDSQDRDSVLAALQLSSQKWGHFYVEGSEAYKATCVKLAAEHGFKITNEELKERIAQERQRIEQERAQAMKAHELKQFEAYHKAVGAERYRVTSIKMQPGGSKLTFILDKKDGITRGFTAEEIAQRTPEMQRLQKRGENLYYTPLSEQKHHILIDDMDRAKLERLIRDGYKPAVVLESSPGNYQAIITIPKLKTEYDRDVGNRLAEKLNREYGDPKLSGAIHPHRAPGFENRKPQHQKEDGTYPEVRLLKAELRECDKTLKLSRELDIEYRLQAKEKAVRATREPKPEVEPRAVSRNAIEAYRQHHQDVMCRQGGQADLSRVDSMIAVRMRVTGHSQQEIESALRHCAPTTREESEGRDWADYAQRTARYAFGVGGDRQVEELARYREPWRVLERPEPEFRRERGREMGMGR